VLSLRLWRLDIAFGDTGIRRSILSSLANLYPGVYTEKNVALSSTHQHAGVGGYTENLLTQITSLGYVKETADAIVQGTVVAVQRAHKSLAPGSLSLGNVNITGGNRNRSPSAYLANPASERAQYNGDQDTTLTLLKFTGSSGAARGFLGFFPVHGTSIYEVRLFCYLGTILECPLNLERTIP
jgi:neutral ceramidase